MKALIYTEPEQLIFSDADDPQPGKGEVVVKVDSVGICGSDMHAFLGHDDRRPAPLILGHEAAGIIADGKMSGQRVTINPLVVCGKCRACLSGRDNLCLDRQIISMQPRQGGFAEYVGIPADNVVPVPDGFSLEKACMAEPIACGWHAARMAKDVLDMDIASAQALVIGGGAIGVGAALSLIAAGVTEICIVDPNQTRREHLLEMQGWSVLEPAELPKEAAYDLVIDGVGFAQSRATASAAVRPGGIIMHIGLGSSDDGLDIRRLTLQEITFIGTYTYTAMDFRATADAMFNGDLGPLDWYESRPLSEGQIAFTDIRRGVVPAPKIILKP